MIQKLKDYIKKSRFIATIYYYCMYILYWILDHTLKKKNKIMFVSFSGRQYSDSPKVLFEYIKEDERFKDYEFIWAFNEPDEFSFIEDAEIININSIKYLIELFSCRVWVSNASIEKLIPYKPQKIFYLNTWHGVPLKKIGADEKNVGPLIKNWYKKVEFDLLTACSDYDLEIFKKVFPSSINIKKYGLPRNKNLSSNKFLKSDFCEKNGISAESRLVLYAPTFREESNEVNKILEGKLLPKNDSNTVILLRTHYFEKVNSNYTNVINVSEYSLDELMNVSECLITDYSSIIFDYHLLNKPIYIYAYDYQEYSKSRGLYKDYYSDLKIKTLSDRNLVDIFTEDDLNFAVNDSIGYFEILNNIKIINMLDDIMAYIRSL